MYTNSEGGRFLNKIKSELPRFGQCYINGRDFLFGDLLIKDKIYEPFIPVIINRYNLQKYVIQNFRVHKRYKNNNNK